MGMRVERDPLGSVLLLSCLQLREDLPVSANLLPLKLLCVRDIREQLANVIDLPAERVDIITNLKRAGSRLTHAW
jgi:hypothetical protein